ncbi:hypothetical protein D9619_002407 [Psilocybe cf. subviscida]|uniref:Uncharacterized protein n=1 Tax=Psilocybe cf. subviscida TaxID=2480587 RepID=A0A8H5AWU4_9AGAR|nr:hypothetical protein D9619_002407 [Psilocybe cf. subviscida]
MAEVLKPKVDHADGKGILTPGIGYGRCKQINHLQPTVQVIAGQEQVRVLLLPTLHLPAVPHRSAISCKTVTSASESMEKEPYEHTASLIRRVFGASMLANTPPHSSRARRARYSDIIDSSVYSS